MRKCIAFLLLTIVLSTGCSTGTKEISYGMDTVDPTLSQVEILVNPGPDYLHEFPLFLFISLHNPPQMVLWAETTEGQFIDTLMVTEKIGTMKWMKASKDPVGDGQIRRLEALPVWEWKRGVLASDGLPLPTSDTPMPDAITHASPKADFSVRTDLAKSYDEVYLYFEVNHSTDFNDTYTADEQIGSENYNGGVMGSGQPALVYRAYVNFTNPELSSKTFELIGHSSPSGTDGNIYTDMQGIDSALGIIESISPKVYKAN
ncbi:hypothetical protein SpiGrapes_0057 [Sphaerochaeta pleomorpha str. Grapes]|uniref:Lipoprotein n=1 Tax=Sphaerochaeta pleomorpha (strain ATCC BAA-1885 / DSM 22778 / Grapes) TaxID=158190 RepID=G8QT16_SPHPG|nr:hypothetical protein [Sphaerochaeta pleomorpha]AEV27921.1 hypothetical protein SpiGrapes_0057 [Sphaerochaeta pleomorpha str. Grapes]